jgi:ribosomal protein L37AE/L43A
MSSQNKTWKDDQRCPNCLELGKLRYLYGRYFCDQCDQFFASDWLGHWNKAFNQGMEFGRQTGYDAGWQDARRKIWDARGYK